MPLPVGQIAVFVTVAVPYVLILTLVGMPFSHTWVWLYALPPGALTWLVTRPVLDGKRLPELVLSQLRYVAEPRTWCRMMPVAERDHVIVSARVWRAPASLSETGVVTGARPAADRQIVPARPARPDRVAVSRPGLTLACCRAVVRVPRDARPAGGGALDMETVRAFTGPAGALITGLAETPPAGSAPAGQVCR